MLFFKKRRKKQTEETFEELESEGTEKKATAKKSVEHIAIENCEQLIELSGELEDAKNEYRVITSYLGDVELLENLPPDEAKMVADIAQNVVQLNNARDEFLQTSKKISDAHFTQMQQEEANMPAAIKRLQSNELYQMTVKRDMTYLEGKKHQWAYHKEEMIRQKKIMKNAAYALLGIFVIVAIVLTTLTVGFDADTKVAWTILLFAATACGIYIFYKMQDAAFEIKQSDVNINGAITLLNKVKIKYVNITNAVDYACEKFHVKNAYELNYVWEQYMETVKEKEKYERTNEDLEYFNGRLIRVLEQYHLYDSKVWVAQANALTDKKEMVEVKHELLVRRQNARNQIAFYLKEMKKERRDVKRMMKKMGSHTEKVQEILDAIDRMSGLEK